MLRLYYALNKLEFYDEEIWDTLLTGLMTKRVNMNYFRE